MVAAPSIDRVPDYRRLTSREPRSILLESTRQPSGGRSFFFSQPLAWLTAETLDELPALFARLEAAKAAGLWTAGYFSYECGYHWEPSAALDFVPAPGSLPLAAFGVYRRPAISASLAPSAALARGLRAARLMINPADFAHKVDRIHRWIEAGDTYQVNLTDRVTASFDGHASELFTHMMEAQPVDFGAMLNLGDVQILSASPELFFHLQGRRITVRPMKGTSRRGRSEEEDAALVQALGTDAKNRAENLMIVDLLRNDLGRVATMGSVEVDGLFLVERFPSLLQMSSQVSATLEAGTSMYSLFRALFPSGSIVGAPKIRTMQIIRELEAQARGVYTGAIGFFAPDGEAVFSVAIRTAVLRGGQVTMGAGAGITYDSRAPEEYAECTLKARFLEDRSSLGLIESMRWEKGSCTLLALHVARILASARHFGFPLAAQDVLAAIHAEASRLSVAETWKLRLVANSNGQCVVTSSPIDDEQDAVLRVMLWPEPVCSGDEYLQHKTTRRLVYDRAVRQARKQGCVDAIFCNEHGVVTEGAIHNIFVRHGDTWRTPPLAAGVLPGVCRAHLLQHMPAIQQSEFAASDLFTADEIWVTNAVRGVRRVVLE